MADQIRRVDYYYVEVPDKPGEGVRVLGALSNDEKRKLLDGALVVVTADHGEEFKDHGKFQHDQLFQELLHVPDAGATTQEMSRAAVAERVHIGLEFNLQSVVADAVGDHLIRQATASNREPQCRCGCCPGCRSSSRSSASGGRCPPVSSRSQ